MLDDGWFRHRRDDTAGLGDWYVDEGVWPDGLTPLAEHVRGLGMEFGLWFEPEMINEDSDLARAHPEWILQPAGRLPVRSRHQQVLDLTNRAAFAHILERITAIATESRVGYIKWDHNRDLIDAGSALTGRPAVHDQTLAVYRLMDAVRGLVPGLEIESCSSGGSRVDLAVIEHTDRVWVSDCNDPLERQDMLRWTQQLLPPELLGSHIASSPSHTTGRHHELAFRAATALPGHLGVEWDLTAASTDEIDELRDWVALHKTWRDLLHAGDLFRADEDETLRVSGVVARDGERAIFFLAYVGRSEVSPRGRVRLPGLIDDLTYIVRPVLVRPDPAISMPAWHHSSAPLQLTGAALRIVGIQAPASVPERVVILQVTATR